MKTTKNLFIVIFALAIYLGGDNANAQSCKQSFLSAQEQYNGGRHEIAQKLLNTCIKSFDANTNQDQVFMFYKLYIASCAEKRDKNCMDAKRKELIKFFTGKIDENDVLKRLNQTRI